MLMQIWFPMGAYNDGREHSREFSWDHENTQMDQSLRRTRVFGSFRTRKICNTRQVTYYIKRGALGVKISKTKRGCAKKVILIIMKYKSINKLVWSSWDFILQGLVTPNKIYVMYKKCASRSLCWLNLGCKIYTGT